MHIRQLQVEAGPEGVVLPGRERDVPDDFGAALIACGAAALVPAPTVKQVASAEAAVEPPAAEAAVEPGRPAKRRVRG
jgi:hypothetical protein